MSTLHVLKVFVGADGRGGNPLGVFLDGGAFAAGQRQSVATDLNYSETVFVDDTATGALQIFTPAAELPFAGHPLVGTAGLLGQPGPPVDPLRPPPGAAPAPVDGHTHWLPRPPAWAPPRGDSS